MIKTTKVFSIIMIGLSLLFSIGGVSFSILAEENRGSEITSGYMQNGTYITTDKYVLNADQEKEEMCEVMSIVCYVFAGIMLCGGISLAIMKKRMDNTKTIRQHGVILEKKGGIYESVIVEFDDNNRKKLIIEPPVIVAKGDKGIIVCKNNSLVEFVKEV